MGTKWKARWQLLGAGALVGLGLDAATFASLPLLLIALILVATGVMWLLRTLLTGSKDGVLYRNRREILLALGTTSMTLLLIVLVAAAVRLGPRRVALENQKYDAALGWGPPDVADRVGQRGQAVDPSRPHIVVIGDSILYGHGVADDETAPHYLEQELRGRYQVLNLSVSGYSIDQYYVYLKRVLPTVNPKLVIVGIFTGNDYEVTGLEYGWGHTKPLFKLRDGGLVLHNDDLLADNCIDHLAQSLLFRTLWMRKELALDLIHLFCTPAKLAPEELHQVIGKLFGAIEAEAHRYDAPVLFVLLPIHDHLRTLEEGRIRHSYHLLRQLLDAGPHRYYELYPDIVRAAGLAEEGIFLDGAHYTPRGNQLLARSLASVINSTGLLEASGRD